MKKETINATSMNGSEASTTRELSKESLSYHKIGDNIRKYRKGKNMKLLDLANATKISSAMLSKIENGRMIPTIPTLFSIISKLNISPEVFFSELNAENKFPGYIFIPQSAYTPYVKEENAVGFDYYFILEHIMDSGTFQISLLQLSPKSKRPPVTTAAYEYVYVINGSVKYALGDNIFEMHTGDSLFFDGSLRHVPINESKGMVIMLVVYFFTDSRS